MIGRCDFCGVIDHHLVGDLCPHCVAKHHEPPPARNPRACPDCGRLTHDRLGECPAFDRRVHTRFDLDRINAEIRASLSRLEQAIERLGSPPLSEAMRCNRSTKTGGAPS
ncbi:MAG: hypothetical protein AUJ55_11680 [Proteobacteria bacterium CG1_02_64_396]|nr:MAG: hypothetical protein AUJ55_11680 [Proteobacteria bacterium CG1_02_64_396]